VGCQIVSAPGKPFLAVKRLQPGEGQDTAARRLLAQQIGWDFLITLRQENREVYRHRGPAFHRRASRACPRTARPRAGRRRSLPGGKTHSRNHGWNDLTQH
jgi:hypothetical protein